MTYLSYIKQGLAKFELGDYQGAIQDFDNAIKLNPENDDAYRYRGIAKGKLGDYQGAIQDLANAIRLNLEDNSML